jgi:methylated-DNA-protein-cysteine methyltransferase-like protein
MKRALTPKELSRKLMRAPASAARDAAIRHTIGQIPKGKVATYAQVAARAGYPLYHRQVVQVLRKSAGTLPWQRVVGAGGHIRTMQDHGLTQRLLLQAEGVEFQGKRVDMLKHQCEWEY